MAGASSSSNSAASSPSRRAGSGQSELPLVLCPYCHTMLVERMSGTAENYRRKFYRCITSEHNGDQCRFLKWQGEYAVWLLHSGYLRISGSEVEHNACTIADVRDALRSIHAAMKEMNSELKASMEAIRVGLAANTAMVNRNSRILDKRLSVGSVFVVVLLVFVAVVLARK